jgi:hypothetical protein
VTLHACTRLCLLQTRQSTIRYIFGCFGINVNKRECWRLCRAELLTVEPENHPDLDSSRSSCIGIASSTNRFGSGKKGTSRLYLCSVHLSMATVCSSVGHVGAACGPNPTRQRKKQGASSTVTVCPPTTGPIRRPNP